jgi:DNA-binding MarR family transcriptional regulator
MQTRREYCSLRTIRKATAMTQAQVDNAMLQLQRAGLVEMQRYPRYMYRVIPAMPGEVK